MSDQEMRDRLIRLETIIGDENRGLLSELQAVKKSVDELKAFQLRAKGAFGVMAIGAQIIIQLVLK